MLVGCLKPGCMLLPAPAPPWVVALPGLADGVAVEFEFIDELEFIEEPELPPIDEPEPPPLRLLSVC